jgi:hypothetical protein
VAYERAIAIAPDSDGATRARRGLVELLRGSDDPGKREAIAQNLQAITAATGELGDLVAWADELRRQNVADAGRATLDLAIACGHAADVHQRAFLSIHAPYTMRDDEPFKATLDGDRALIRDPEESELGPIAVLFSEAAALLWPDLDEVLARNDATGARRIPATRNIPVTAMFSRIATALGAGAVMLYEHDAGPPRVIDRREPASKPVPDVTVVNAATPVIVLGPRMLAPATPTPEIRAILTRAVELTRPEHAAFAGLPLVDVTRIIASAIRLFGPDPLRDASNLLVADPDVQRGHDEMVKAALPVKIRSRLEQLLVQVSPAVLDARRYRAACERSADRAALLLDGDPRIIANLATARGEGHEHLISAIAHPTWLPLRARLGLGVR